jgi:hypothetical protein
MIEAALHWYNAAQNASCGARKLSRVLPLLQALLYHSTPAQRESGRE